MKPITNKVMLAIKEKSPGVISKSLLIITARPVTPPNEKLFGNLKKYIPVAESNVPKFSNKKVLRENFVLSVCGFVQVACQGFLVREACVGVLVGGAVFLLSGVQ